MLIVDLFSGGGSVTRVLRRVYPRAKIITVDTRSMQLMDSLHTHIRSDILGIDTDTFRGVDLLWASPPCEHYSVARRGAKHPPDLQRYDSYVKRALDIIAVCKPAKWYIENPGGGAMLHKRPFMMCMEPYRRETTYCKWGFKYRKVTSIWSNRLRPCAPDILPMCRSRCPCANVVDGRHAVTAQDGRSLRPDGSVQPSCGGIKQRWSIPEPLIKALLAL